MKNRQRGMADFTAIILALCLGLLLIGFFRSSNEYYSQLNKSALRLSCGLTYKGITENQKITFPLTITGYINGCGWNNIGPKGGSVQIFDAKGMPITPNTEMTIDDKTTQIPLSFTTTLHPNFVPQTENGQLIFQSNTGFLKIVPVTF